MSLDTTSSQDTDDSNAALVIELTRLLREVEAINRQLERIETEMQRAFNGIARERFEEYR